MRKGPIMMDIFVGVLVVLVAAAGVWAWWIEHNNKKDDESPD